MTCYRLALLLVLFAPSFSQKIANRKCREYFNAPGAFARTSLGIVGGSLTHHSEFPHMAALGFGSVRNPKWLCGGTVISENYVLTAAHCTNNQEHGSVKMVRMGVRNLKDLSYAIDSPISKITVHPNYKPPALYNDIALIKLKNPIQFSKFILPACLNTAFDIKPRRNQVTATGWGLLSFGGSSSDNLMKVDLNLYNQRQCQANYASTSKEKLPKGIDNKLQLCAGGRGREEKDTCQGDSGGPLVMKTGILYNVVGVTAFGKACGIASVPGVYTRVSSYVSWIEKNVW